MRRGGARGARRIECTRCARGGDVTYHAPGQLVGYPIVDLAARDARDVHAWLRTLEGADRRGAASRFGVPSARARPAATGVFVDAPSPRARRSPRSASRVRGWVTLHGFALNVDLDLAGFDAIVPCGLAGVEMTSVARELGRARRATSPTATRAEGEARRASSGLGE